MNINLLYRNRVNTIFGQSEVGKSWFGLYHCLRAVRTSPTACSIYVDYEDDVTGMVTRLRTIGATPAEAGRILYLQARSPLSDALVDALIATKIKPFMARKGCDDLVVIVVDSVDALISVAKGSSNSANDTRGVLDPLKRLAEKTHAAVLTIDHESEKSKGGAAMQMGSSAKKQVIDGVMLRADKVSPWRPGQPECATNIVVAKDRHGLVRAQTTGHKDTPNVARLVMRVDPDGWGSTLTLESPEPEQDTDMMTDAVLEYLFECGGSAFSRRTAEDVVLKMNKRYSRATIEEHLAFMVEEGLIEIEEGAKAGRATGTRYTLPKEE